MTTINVNTRYIVGKDTEIDLPEDKTKEDIESIDAYHCKIFITFKDGTQIEAENEAMYIELANYLSDDADIITADEDGDPDFYQQTTCYFRDTAQDMNDE